jgi:hypothetical protein
MISYEGVCSWIGGKRWRILRWNGMTRGKLDTSEKALPFADFAFNDGHQLESHENTVIAVDE